MQIQAATGSETPHLIAAILVYGTERREKMASWLSVHQIGEREGRAVILPGQAATREGLRALLAGIDGLPVPTPSLLHPRLLAKGDGYLAWWCPPGRRQVWFRSDEPLGNRTGVAPHPGLVFMASEDKGIWSVHAVCGTGRPAADTPLFQAPYFNVYADGKICTGNVDVPKGAAAQHPEAWEECFFRSYFTHPNVARGLVNYRPGAVAFWRMLLDGRRKSFPDERLVPVNLTVAGAFNRLMEGK